AWARTWLPSSAWSPPRRSAVSSPTDYPEQLPFIHGSGVFHTFAGTPCPLSSGRCDLSRVAPPAFSPFFRKMTPPRKYSELFLDPHTILSQRPAKIEASTEKE
ncbi:hypothetical protein, partial [Anaerotruncus sp. AF02-27]|uniref:hypothetical protein n=1 Tax=Anaerotruncus sp. AF02-27 TaxID=2292191 RepID=UPI001A9A6DFF